MGIKSGPPVEPLLLNKAEVESLFSWKEAIEVDDEVYKACGLGEVFHPDIGIFNFMPEGEAGINEIISLPAYIKSKNVVGIKWASFYFKQQPGIPLAWGHIIVLNRPENGQIFAIMDGTAVTNARTACSSAVAAKYLARKNSRTMTMVGCGAEARTHLYALKELFPIEVVKIYDIKPEAMTAYKQELETSTGVKIIPANSAKEACEGSDIICMLTTSMKPVVMEPWVPAGCFVTGLMAFNDLDPALTTKADKWITGRRTSDEYQSNEYGAPVDYDNCYAEMGEVAAGAKPGRENDKERIVFTHYGMGAHDVGLANFVYNKAVKQGLGTKIKLI